MTISYHKNAKTTVLMRHQIKESSESIESLAIVNNYNFFVLYAIALNRKIQNIEKVFKI